MLDAPRVVWLDAGMRGWHGGMAGAAYGCEYERKNNDS